MAEQQTDPKQGNFETALWALKNGKRVARAGWNGKGMWLVLVNPGAYTVTHTDTISDPPRRLPWIGMKTADGGFVPWLASQTDLLANDWIDVTGAPA